MVVPRAAAALGAMLDQLDLIVRWFVDDIRPGDSKSLFCGKGSGPIHWRTIRYRLRRLLEDPADRVDWGVLGAHRRPHRVTGPAPSGGQGP